jgi:hypothetical protein
MSSGTTNIDVLEPLSPQLPAASPSAESGGVAWGFADRVF